MGRYRMLEIAVRRFRDNPFATIAGETWSYERVHAATMEIAAGLSSLDSPRIAVLARNHPLYMVSTFAMGRAGATSMAISNKNKVGANIDLCRRGEAEMLVISADEREAAEEIAAEVPSIHTILAFDGPDEAQPELLAWARQQRSRLSAQPPGPEYIEGLSPTGGTTGASKLAQNSSRSLDVMVANVWARLPLESYTPVNLVVPPLSHAAGAFALILTPAGVRHVVHESFDAEKVIRALVDEQITDLYLPPTAIYNLLAHPDVRSYSYPHLRHLYYAGSPISGDKLREAMEVFGEVMTQFYGQSEVPLTAVCLTPADHATALGDHPERILSCGRPTILTDITILDDDDNELAPGERGEVAARGDLVMNGYLGDATRAPLDWHRTGDVGYFDELGYLYLIDRKRDVIVSGGFNVFPIEVEQVLWAHPAVEDCAVIGIPHEKWGEQVTGVVQLKPGMSATAEELILRCREELGPIKAPKQIDFVDELPKSPVGKVLKRELRDTYWEGHDRKI
ncbi:MAG: AMP-binding protein [Ilumatobacteraceae bacterium]